MFFKQIPPSKALTDYIQYYWVVEDTSEEQIQQKIIPDGYPEIIFHYAQTYKINISGAWKPQTKCLLAGQISNHFHLKNTGQSGMIGIKFMPTALSELFSLDMSLFTDRVVDLPSAINEKFDKISAVMTKSTLDYTDKIQRLNHFFEEQVKHRPQSIKVRQALAIINQSKGTELLPIILERLEVSERQLERLFKRFVGLSPKRYCRIKRFSYIFEHIQQQQVDWSTIAQIAGFYDQSHFIKNFKEFTGEDPSAYFFEEHNMANFFLQKAT